MSYTYHKMELQNSRGLSGSGIISNLFKIAKPFVKKIASSAFKSGKKTLLKQGKNAAYRMISDKILGKDMKSSLRNNALNILSKTAISGLNSGLTGLKEGANYKMGRTPKKSKKKVKSKRGIKKIRKQPLKGRGKNKMKTPGLSQSQFNTLVKKWKKTKMQK